jgi:gliding motility-associated-like protein
LGCPTNGPNWQLLGSKRIDVGEGNKWVNTNILVTPPENINAIAIGPSCSTGPVQRSLYYFFDNLILADIKLFDLAIEEVNNPCSQDFTLTVPKANNLDYQWYLNGIALVGESDAELSQNYGEGEYQIRITEDGLCRVSGKFQYQIPKIYTSPLVVICEEDTYEFGGNFYNQSGTYLDTFTSRLGCDSIVSLELKVLGEIADTINVEIFKGDSYTIANNTYYDEGEYLNTLESSLGCDSLVLLDLDLFTVYTPNIFSPNDDGFNDAFTIQGDNSLFTLRNLRVYDKWGNLMYEGREWNGEYRGEKVREGVYTYTAQLLFANGNQELLQGTITLVR